MLNFLFAPSINRPVVLDIDAIPIDDDRSLLDRNIASFRQVRDAHNVRIDELDMQIAERQEERRQCLATVAMCDAALATVEPIE